MIESTSKANIEKLTVIVELGNDSVDLFLCLALLWCKKKVLHLNTIAWLFYDMQKNTV